MALSYKRPPSKSAEQVALEDCLLKLLRGIQSHSPLAGGSGGQAFRAELAALEHRFQEKNDPRQLVDSAVAILSKYEAQANQAGAVVDPDIQSAGTGSGEAPSTARVYTPDPLTGLSSRGHAEVELRAAHAESPDRYMALFVVKRLALINAKFGYSRGDQVLVKVVAHLRLSLPEFDNLFRWAPCAFLTLAPANTSYKELRAKIQIIELTRLSPMLEWEGHSAMVPVVIDCRIVSAKDFGTPSDLFLRLDTLAADG